MNQRFCVCVGKVCAGRDVVVFLSHGGGTRECIEAASYLVRRGVAVLAITSNPGCIFNVKVCCYLQCMRNRK